jgi:histone H3/H4
MSNTRRTTDAGKFRQERFASSLEFERGLMANLVAKRAALLESPADREAIWFLQYLSHQPGGIKKLAADLLAQFPECVATPSMQKFGFKKSQIYSADQVKAVRGEVEGGGFPLKGEADYGCDYFNMSQFVESECAEREVKSKLYPAKYPASDFVELCVAAAETNLEKYLMSLCLDPALPVEDGSPWYFPTLISSLQKFMVAGIESHCEKTVVTSLGERVHEALEYAAETGRMTLIEGSARFGKTYSVMDWCLRHPGRARYVQLESTSDDMSFYRAIAKALGVSITLTSKAQDLRMRIEEALQPGNLVLVLDEAHYLWPNLIDSRSLPTRINWILTALVNRGVPVVLVTTPQFLSNQRAFEHKTRWTSEQLTGRLGYYEKLPDVLPIEDLEKIASALLGDVDPKIVQVVVDYANGSAKYLAGITTVIDRARFVARKEGRDSIQFADIKRAIKESVIPSDKAFAIAMQPAERVKTRRAFAVQAEPLQPDFKPVERQVTTTDFVRSRSGLDRVDAVTVH